MNVIEQTAMGQRRDVPQWTWIKLARPAANGNISYKAGDTVGIHGGAQVEVIGTDPDYGVLVVYSVPRGMQPFGTSCPDRAMFFMSPETFVQWPDPGSVSARKQDEDKARESAVRRLLSEGGNRHG